MSHFGPIQYEDMATLNAQWQEARPAVHGLGAIFGQHEYRDVSFLNARLRPILPSEVGMPPPSTYGYGAGTLTGNTLGAVGDVTLPETTITGDGAPTFTKAQILETQDLLNGALIQHGYKQINTDGDLGPATCGAIEWYQDNVNPQGGATYAEACSTVKGVAPTKAAGGGTKPSVPGSAKADVFGTGGGDTNWLLWGGAIAAIAVGGAMIFRASKKR